MKAGNPKPNYNYSSKSKLCPPYDHKNVRGFPQDSLEISLI